MDGSEGSLEIAAVSRAVSFATVPASGSDVPPVFLLSVAPAPVIAMKTYPAVPKETNVVGYAAPAPGCSFADAGWGEDALASSAQCRCFLGFTSSAVEVLFIFDLWGGLMWRLRETCIVKEGRVG